MFGIPSSYVFFRAFRRWRKEPFAVKLKNLRGTIMPPQRFFLSLGLAGVISFALCMAASFVFYIPSLTFYGVLAFTILIKTSSNRQITLPSHRVLRLILLVGDLRRLVFLRAQLD